MNYLLKLQSPAGLLEALPNNTSRCGGKRSNICGHCLHKYGLFWPSAREISFLKALKLANEKKALLDKNLSKKIVSKAANKEKINEAKTQSEKLEKSEKTSYKFAEYVNVTNKTSTRHKVKVQEITPSQVKKFAERPGMMFENVSAKPKFILNSIHSYDPYLLNPTFGESLEPGKSTITRSNLKKNLVKNAALSSQKEYSNKRQIKEKEMEVEDQEIDFDVRKILPLNAVEIFPKPKPHKKPGESGSLSVTPNYKDSSLFTMIPSIRENYGYIFGNGIEEISFDMETLIPEANESYFCQEIPVENVSKELTFMKLVESYMDVCISNKMVDEALTLLKSLQNKQKWTHIVGHENLVHMYNKFLRVYSEKGNINAVNTITQLMKKDKVNFNPQTYVYLLDCLGALSIASKEQKKKELIKIFKHMDTLNVSLNDLFTKTKLEKEKSEAILSLVRTVYPDFEVTPRIYNLNSNCTLLENLHQNFNGLQSHLSNNLSLETLEKLIEEQLLLEKHYSVTIKGIGDFSKQKSQVEKFENWKSDWREALESGFLRNLKIAEAEYLKNPSKLSLYVYLKSLPPKTFVDVMMRWTEHLLMYSGSFSPTLNSLSRNMGNDLFRCYTIKASFEAGVLERTEKLFKKYCAWCLEPSGPARNSRQEWQMTLNDFNEGLLLDVKPFSWPTSVRVALGKLLYNIIFKEVRVHVNVSSQKNSDKCVKSVPVFYSVLRRTAEACNEEVKCHPFVSSVFKRIGLKSLTFFADELPMVCPPKPWKSVHNGGYLVLPTEFVRPPQEVCGKLVDWKKIPDQQLYSVLDGLNALQAVPWIINENVFDVIEDVFLNGGSEELNVPVYPDITKPLKLSKDLTFQERKQKLYENFHLNKKMKENYSIWCESYYRLSLANHFRKRIFWLPQNIDFRGRVYPVPPHLNHLGCDLFRSMLLFAKGKPLGPKGLDWLKIHAINLCGTHKDKSVKERLDYANSMMSEIIDSAENPLTGRRWWSKADEPWQTLSTCMEIKKAISCSRPEEYVSHFPIHQDGSCNGLQHYAALGKDTIGAESVNLAPLERPQDVYSRVVEIVESKRKQDSEDGVKVAQILEGFVRRKVIKQTVMTTVYGVTFYGAKLQIYGQLKDIAEFPKESLWPAAEYLAQKTFESLREMFTSAKKIQDWFVNCADVITKGGEYVQWVSPLGLPIVQYYGNPNNVLFPNRKKQRNAFPPNFIHSLDSCHMMMTTLFCEQAGITFASIHDCFWTHPSSVDIMNYICREQFITLHSQKILENLSNFFKKSYPQGRNEELDRGALKMFNSLPEKGNFSIEKVMNSVYFFS